MTDEFPGNTAANRKDPEPEKEIRQVSVGDVKTRRRPLGKRFTENFVQNDARTVWGYVVFDVLVPAAKDMVSDAVSLGVERMLFGEARARRGRTSTTIGSGLGSTIITNPSHTSYSKPTTIRQEPRSIASSRHNFDEFVFEHLSIAEGVIAEMTRLTAEYGVCTVADLFEICGKEKQYVDNKWGWDGVAMNRADARRIRGGGYVLDLPEPLSLK